MRHAGLITKLKASPPPLHVNVWHQGYVQLHVPVIPPYITFPSYELYSYSNSAFTVQFEAITCVLKNVTFAHEIPSLKQEVNVYHFLASRGSTLLPKLLGYACEQERIVGFLSEMVVRRFLPLTTKRLA